MINRVADVWQRMERKRKQGFFRKLAGQAWRPEGEPIHQDHQYIRGKTAKFLTLFRPVTGELRAKAVDQSTNAILHPWLKQELEAILKECPPARKEASEGYRWQDWNPTE